MHLFGEDAHVYRGNYTAFEQLRGEELERQQAMAAKQQAQVAHIQQFVDRFRAKASKAKQVQSRIKALEKMRSQAILHVDSNYRVDFSDPEKVSNPLFSFRNLSLGYGDNTILRNIGQTILPGARIGVLGVNGAEIHAAKGHCRRAVTSSRRLSKGYPCPHRIFRPASTRSPGF